MHRTHFWHASGLLCLIHSQFSDFPAVYEIDFFEIHMNPKIYCLYIK